jgi:16S rRNA (cytosine967-C5)-methyltransferase
MNSVPPLTLRCNLLKSNPKQLAEALKAQADDVRPLDTLPEALNLIGLHCPIHEMQAFIDGRFAVQDAAAQLVSLLLSPLPDETILDACAGLGGKTTHIAGMMQNRGCVIALDKATSKLTSLEREALRQGITIVQTKHANLNRPLSTASLPSFDRVLLDAPCTGLGVLRRNPDAKWSTRKKDIARFADRQLHFLENLAPLVKPGGVLVFSVCSMEPEENEGVIKRFLKNHPNFVISHQQTIEEKNMRPFLDQNGFFRTFPHNHQMDGFFAARLWHCC